MGCGWVKKKASVLCVCAFVVVVILFKSVYNRIREVLKA